MGNIRLIFIISLFFVFSGPAFSLSPEKSQTIRIACVGDSLSYGYGLLLKGLNSYPGQLSRQLPHGYDVKNFGINGASATRNSDDFYLNNSYRDLQKWNPHLVVIMLGSNDSKNTIWISEYEYLQGLNDIVSIFNAEDSGIILMTPPPSKPNIFGIDDSRIRTSIIPALERYSLLKDITLLDVYSLLSEEEGIYIDNIHLNKKGYSLVSTFLSEYIILHQQ